MYLIVGLGNPDKKYLNTWHNLGFLCVDKLAEKLGVQFDKAECSSLTAHARVNGEKVIVAKPLTYMNLSGNAVLQLVQRYKVEKGNLLVVYDDVDIAVGSLRIRKNGSAGTHNGMRSIVHLVSEDFPRIRIGSGKQTPMALVDFVLSPIPQEDKPVVDEVLEQAAQASLQFAQGVPLDIIMQQHNKKV